MKFFCRYKINNIMAQKVHKKVDVPAGIAQTTLFCWDCPLLREIAVIPGLQKLECWRCPLLTEIPVIPGLQELQCHFCPLLTKIPEIPGLEKLVCNDCPLLREIPVIPGLQKLDCWGCPLLTEIPIIPGLIELWCYNCSLLKEIPFIPGLRKLVCNDCPLLTQIPPVLSETFFGKLTRFFTGKKPIIFFNECPYAGKHHIILTMQIRRKYISKKKRKIFSKQLPFCICDILEQY
jgi:hypothetical protein